LFTEAKSLSHPSPSWSVVSSRQSPGVLLQLCHWGRAQAYRQPPLAHVGGVPAVWKVTGKLAGHALPHAPQLLTLSMTRVSHPSASDPSVLTAPLQFRYAGSQG
jgi:hypothetical protein